MTIYFTTLKRIFRSKVQLIFILLIPLAFMSIALIDEDKSIRISTIDEDQTMLTKMFQESLASKARIIEAIAEDQIEEKLMNLNVDYVIKIERGFTEQLLQGEQPVLYTYSVAESNLSLPIREYINQWIQDAFVIAHTVGYDREVFYDELENYLQSGESSIIKRSITDEGRGKPRIALGYLAMAMLYTSLISALVIILNRNNYTLYRTMMAPVKMSNYLLQIIASLFTVSIFQILFALGVLQIGFHMFSMTTWFHMFVIFVVYSLISVSLGVLISTFAKNVVQAIIIGVCVIPPISMLGGAYFPLDYASDTVKSLSLFSPVSWMLNGVEKILRGQPITTLGIEVLLMILFAVVFFSLGVIRKVDIAK